MELVPNSIVKDVILLKMCVSGLSYEKKLCFSLAEWSETERKKREVPFSLWKYKLSPF